MPSGSEYLVQILRNSHHEATALDLLLSFETARLESIHTNDSLPSVAMPALAPIRRLRLDPDRRYMSEGNPRSMHFYCFGQNGGNAEEICSVLLQFG